MIVFIVRRFIGTEQGCCCGKKSYEIRNGGGNIDDEYFIQEPQEHIQNHIVFDGDFSFCEEYAQGVDHIGCHKKQPNHSPIIDKHTENDNHAKALHHGFACELSTRCQVISPGTQEQRDDAGIGMKEKGGQCEQKTLDHLIEINMFGIACPAALRRKNGSDSGDAVSDNQICHTFLPSEVFYIIDGETRECKPVKMMQLLLQNFIICAKMKYCADKERCTSQITDV